MTNVEWGNNINFIFTRDQNQEGGTSTPGKRPGCSEHVLMKVLLGNLTSWKYEIHNSLFLTYSHACLDKDRW